MNKDNNPDSRKNSGWLKIGEARYLKEDSEWYLVMLDIADLIANYSKHPVTSDPKEYAARAISFVLSHNERQEQGNDLPTESSTPTQSDLEAQSPQSTHIPDKHCSCSEPYGDLICPVHNVNVHTGEAIPDKVLREAIRYRVTQEYQKYHNDLTFDTNGKDFWIEQIVTKLADSLTTERDRLIEALEGEKRAYRPYANAHDAGYNAAIDKAISIVRNSNV